MLSAAKTYLMFGCLGGLGQSRAKRMMACGARNFVFLGRSGLDEPVARVLIEDLQKNGAVAGVVRGDVNKCGGVGWAVETSTLLIGGVIPASMSLSEAFWSSMSNNSWRTSIRPQVQNLRNAQQDQARDAQLDVFVMTSSILDTVGTATESNHCAGNALLDAFARYQNNFGLRAIFIRLAMISEVGYLYEHSNTEALMKRKGVHAINEDELLEIMNLALANQNPKTWKPHYD